MTIIPEDKSISSDILRQSILQVLDSAQLLALATINTQDNEPNCNNAYFCHDDALTIFFMSGNHARHTKLIEVCPNVMCSIYRESEVWGEKLHGVQFAGKCSRLSGAATAKALFLYAKKFSAFKVAGAAMDALLNNSGHGSVFAIRPSRGKVLDEVRFGKRNQIRFTLQEKAPEG